MKYQLLFAALVMLTVTACGTAVPAVTDQTQIDQTQPGDSLEANRVRTPPAPVPVPASLAFRTYSVTVVRNGLTLSGFVFITNETVPNQPGALKATYSISKNSFLALFPASAATVASWVPFETASSIYSTGGSYTLPTIITLGANNSVRLKTGNPDPNSLNQGVEVLNLVGQLFPEKPIPVGSVVTPELVGNPLAAGTTPVTSWSGYCYGRVVLVGQFGVRSC